METLNQSINGRVCDLDDMAVECITPAIVTMGLKKIRDGKNDSQFNIQSNCFMKGPDSLFQHLTNLICTFVLQGFVPNLILIFALLPFVKDNLADITSSDNYGAIASGSLLLKLLDNVVLL